MLRLNGRALTGFLVIAAAADAQTLLSWEQIRERFRTNNPTLKAARLSIDESQAAEITAYLRPNPDVGLLTDGTQLIPQKGDTAMALKVLSRAREVLSQTEFKHDPLDQALRTAAQEVGVKAGQMFQPIRVAVCGRKNAPPLFETLEVLGRETTLKRIDQAIEKLEP